jgi:predicted hotdog family 3-hydroxylacyl-ACP dehydratase
MLATRTTIIDFIPQRDPMVMIHNLLDVNDHAAITELLIEPSNIFVENGFFSEAGMIENMAQTAAVQMGYQCREKGMTVPIGFIAAIKKLEINALPSLHSVITTRADIFDRVSDFIRINGKIMQGEHVLCTCELRLFVKETNQ